MSVIGGILFIVGIMGAIIGFGFYITNHGKNGDEDYMRNGKIAGISCLAVIVIGLLLGSLFTVPAGHRGIVLRFGNVSRVASEGLNTKFLFIDTVEIMSVQTELYTDEAQSASKDLQDVNTTVGINYRVDPLVIGELYRTLGVNYIAKIANPAVQEVVKSVTARFNAEDMILRRSEVKQEIETELAARLAQRGIIAETTNITNFQFSDEFTKAIESKVVAVQAVLEAQNKLERVKVEAQQAVAQAEGEANSAIARAEGQAKANETISKSLTDQVLQYFFLDKLGQDVKVVVIPSSQGLTLTVPQP